MKTVLVIGMGQFGTHVVKALREFNCEVMAIDKNEAEVNEILPYVTSAQIGDATNEAFLRTLGINNYDSCIVALGSHFQSSLETTSLLKELGAKKVVSRATNDVQMKFLLKNGADEVVYPEKMMATRTAALCSTTGLNDFIKLDDQHSIFEISIPAEWVGKTLVQLNVRKNHDINVLSIKREGSVFLPDADTLLQGDDTAYVIGENTSIRKMLHKLS